jgi:hypothetical protein
MSVVHEEALEHLTADERACVLSYLELVGRRLGARLLEVHLFGSFACGDAWSARSPMHSDVDLLILCTERPSADEIAELNDATYPIFLECGRQLAPQFRTREALESPTTDIGLNFLAHFRREGRLVLDARSR